ncbi:MAG: hypothetical protein SFW09_05635 [Hyphomicrobiaceae bacterium]|nr:hypothetical protein [Hyphomicrobiaceae bacterium]
MLPYLLVALLVLGSANATAQPYAPTNAGEISDGYAADGARVEVGGWVWTHEQGTWLNFNQPSARPPMRVDTTGVPAEQMRRVQAECNAPTQFAGGCRATVRGVAQRQGDRAAIVAHAIAVGEVGREERQRGP